MKNVTLSLILLFSSCFVYAQTLPQQQTTLPEKSDLLSKSKRQKTIGWVMFGTGLPVVLFTGYFLVAADKNDIDKPLLTKVFVASTAYTLVSIPLIRAGRNNQKRALSMSFQTLEISMPGKVNLGSNLQKAIALHIAIP